MPRKLKMAVLSATVFLVLLTALAIRAVQKGGNLGIIGAAAGGIACCFFVIFHVWSKKKVKRKNTDSKPADTLDQERDNSESFEENEETKMQSKTYNVNVGLAYHIGGRKEQQDSFGYAMTRCGFLAVVADGMGGLENGDKISQQAVKGMFQAAEVLKDLSLDNPLYEMLRYSNEQVRRLLEEELEGQGGSTLLAVLTDGKAYHWISVGDSRIYLYYQHHLVQLNQEHIYQRELIRKAVNKSTDFAAAAQDTQKECLVSYLGMENIETIDGSLKAAELQQGDKLLMMSDGVFHAISEQKIIQILEKSKNAEEAAMSLEESVLEAKNAHQDNFTCLILEF